MKRGVFDRKYIYTDCRTMHTPTHTYINCIPIHKRGILLTLKQTVDKTIENIQRKAKIL